MVSRHVGEDSTEVPVVRRIRRWLEDESRDEPGRVPGAKGVGADVRVLERRLERLAACVPGLAARVQSSVASEGARLVCCSSGEADR